LPIATTAMLLWSMNAGRLSHLCLPVVSDMAIDRSVYWPIDGPFSVSHHRY
uniref:Transmembrane protein n=1 Tax=Haemonchus placei TaxID=6290 RepID=A0A0N4WWW4_HAEPC